MGSTMEALMQKRLKEKQDAYDAQWDSGNGSHHPDYDPTAAGPNVHKASTAPSNRVPCSTCCCCFYTLKYTL